MVICKLSINQNFSDKIKFYTSRYADFCADNGELSEHLNPSPVLFGSFNIQVFGVSKYGKTEVKDQIVTILRRYDIVTIQVKLCLFILLEIELDRAHCKWNF